VARVRRRRLGRLSRRSSAARGPSNKACWGDRQAIPRRPDPHGAAPPQQLRANYMADR